MNPNDYGPEHKSHLLEQYKLYVEMADRVSQRRDQSNRFYVTILSALAAVVVVITRFGVPVDGMSPNVVFFAIGLFGIALSFIWRLNIKSYRVLNRAKYKIINKIEENLPLQGYSDEWDLLENPPPDSDKYLQLTRVEQRVPLIFIGLFAALTLYALYLLFT